MHVRIYVCLSIHPRHAYIRPHVKKYKPQRKYNLRRSNRACQRGHSRFIYPGSVLWIDYGPNPSTFLTDFKPATDNPSWEETFVWEYNKVTSKICVSVWDRCVFPRVISAMCSFFCRHHHVRRRSRGFVVLTLSLPCCFRSSFSTHPQGRVDSRRPDRLRVRQHQ